MECNVCMYVNMGSWVVCARQKCVVCARQKLFVCVCYFPVILSLYLCNMNLLVDVSSLHHHTTHHCVGFFLTSLCGVFRLAFRAFSSSSSVVPPLTQLHPSSLIQLISQLTQRTSLNSSHRTQLTQELLSCGIWWGCFRVLSLNFT